MCICIFGFISLWKCVGRLWETGEWISVFLHMKNLTYVCLIKDTINLKTPIFHAKKQWLNNWTRTSIKSWFYTRRNEAECRGDIAFLCSCTCVKVLFTETFLKCPFCWKVQIISSFPLRTDVAFFLNQWLLSIHVNKVIHYSVTCLIHSPQYNLKVKWLLANKFNMTLDN